MFSKAPRCLLVINIDDHGECSQVIACQLLGQCVLEIYGLWPRCRHARNTGNTVYKHRRYSSGKWLVENVSLQQKWINTVNISICSCICWLMIEPLTVVWTNERFRLKSVYNAIDNIFFYISMQSVVLYIMYLVIHLQINNKYSGRQYIYYIIIKLFIMYLLYLWVCINLLIVCHLFEFFFNQI